MNSSVNASPRPRPSNGQPSRKYSSRKASSSTALVMTSTRTTPAAPSRIIRSTTQSATLGKSQAAALDPADDDSIYDVPSSEDESSAAPKKIQSLRSVLKAPPAGSAPNALKPVTRLATRISSTLPISDGSSGSVSDLKSVPLTRLKSTSKTTAIPRQPTQKPTAVTSAPPTASSPKRKADTSHNSKISHKRVRSHPEGDLIVSGGSPPRLTATRSAPSQLGSWLHPPSMAFTDPLLPTVDIIPAHNDSFVLSPTERIGSDATDSHAAPLRTTPRKKQTLSRLLSNPLDFQPTERSQSDNVPAPAAVLVPILGRSASDIPRRRRLVDTLKAVSFRKGDETDPDHEQISSLANGSSHNPGGPSLDRPESSLASSAEPVQQPPPQGPQTSQIRRFGKVGSSVGGAKITYGEVRSLLPEEPQTFEQQIDSMLSGLTGRPAEENIDQGLSSPDDTHGAIRSAHELRAAGDKTRFVDDMELLLADLEISSSTSILATNSRRRNVMCELARKCAEKQFVDRMGTFSFEQRVFDLATKEKDPLALMAWCVAVGYILHWTSSRLVAVSVWETLFEIGKGVHSVVISGLLDMGNDIGVVCKERRMNMSRAAVAEYADFKETVLISNVWFNSPPESLDSLSVETGKPILSRRLSPRDVCLKFTDLLVRRLRGFGVMEEPILASESVKRIVLIGSEVVSSALVNDTVAASSTKESLIQSKLAQRTQRSRQLELVLSILESESLSGLSFEPHLQQSLITIISPVFTASLNYSLRGGIIPPDLLRLHTLALRLSLNHTNNNPDACALFSAPDAGLISAIYQSLVNIFCRASAVLKRQLSSSADESDSTHPNGEQTDEPSLDSVHELNDVLILSLGVSINLVEHSIASRAASLETLPPSCLEVFNTFFTSSPSTTASCPLSILSSLLTIFSQAQSLFASTPVAILQAETEKSASVVSQLQVAHGYLAVLIGNICLLPDALNVVTEHSRQCVQTTAAVDSATAPLSQIQTLITTIREFVVYHRATGGSSLHTKEHTTSIGDATASKPLETSPSSGQVDIEVIDTGDGGPTPPSSAYWDGWTKRLLSVVERLESAASTLSFSSSSSSLLPA